MHSTLGNIAQISEKDAARLLITPSALGSLPFDDALRIIAYMKPKRIKAGAVFIHEGEKTHTDFLMLILSGQARVESSATKTEEANILAVVGEGQIVGEIGLLNGGERTADCVAITDLAVAVLSRASLGKLMRDHPALSARFLLALSSRMASRMAETTQKLKRFMKLNTMLQKEVYTLMDSVDRLSKTSSQAQVPAEQPGKRKAPQSSKTVEYAMTEPLDLLKSDFVAKASAKKGRAFAPTQPGQPPLMRSRKA